MSVEEKLKALAENPHAGPPWTPEDQAHYISTFKADFAGLLKSNPWDEENNELLLVCLDALRGELIAWCDGKSS